MRPWTRGCTSEAEALVVEAESAAGGMAGDSFRRGVDSLDLDDLACGRNRRRRLISNDQNCRADITAKKKMKTVSVLVRLAKRKIVVSLLHRASYSRKKKNM